jgi:hypothetical protein
MQTSYFPRIYPSKVGLELVLGGGGGARGLGTPHRTLLLTLAPPLLH